MGKTGTESPTRPKNRVAITFENDPVAPERIVMPTPPRERVSDRCSCSSKLPSLSSSVSVRGEQISAVFCVLTHWITTHPMWRVAGSVCV
mgnify:CR=1 FL=1